MFIPAFTGGCHLSVFWGRSIRFTPPSYFLKIHLILSSLLHLVPRSCLFPLGSPTKNLCTPLLYPMRATCPAYTIILDSITRIKFSEHYRSCQYKWQRGLRDGSGALAWCDSCFEPHRWHGCLSVVSVVCCPVEVSVTVWSLIQRSPTECGVSECHRGNSWKPRPTTAVEPLKKLYGS